MQAARGLGSDGACLLPSDNADSCPQCHQEGDGFLSRQQGPGSYQPAWQDVGISVSQMGKLRLAGAMLVVGGGVGFVPRGPAGLERVRRVDRPPGPLALPPRAPLGQG